MGSVLSVLWNWIPRKSKGTVIGKKLREAIVRPFLRQNYQETYHTEKDWDNLVILDSCRYDTFKKENFLEGDLGKINSAGSHTWEFMKKNFEGDHRDTVYISANPQLGLIHGKFAEVYYVWEEHWNDEKNTVMPSDVTEVAKKAAREHPDKKLVIHYMQPHYPFIGPEGQKIRNQGSYKFLDGKERKEKVNIWEKVFKGEIDIDTVKKAYEENLRQVLHEVGKLEEFLEGKTVVTSDHGNLFGKKVVRWIPYRIYGHPMNFHEKELTSVPWLELPFEKRKDIETSESSKKSARTDEDMKKVEKRLEDLGYLE